MLDPRFAKTEFVVEADDYARLKLWEEFHGRVKWVQHCMGTQVTVARSTVAP